MEEAQLPASPQEQGLQCKGEGKWPDSSYPALANITCVFYTCSLLQIRFAVLQVAEEMYSKLGEEFAVLLPETIPFLAELMEGT